MAEPTPPPLQGPTSKERKYDRQLRLWAANGQKAIEDAHILLINSGAGVAGVEALKNLVLPGIGRFTILDSALVTEKDLGVNFFLEDGDLGAFRAERTCAWLKELNPDVEGHSLSEPLEIFMNRRDALAPFTHILVALPTPPEILQKISEHASANEIPVFYIHSIGFYGHFTLQLPSAFPIVDTHPDPATTTDLRLLDPWPELLQIGKEKTAKLEHMDDEQHGHVPFVLLLLYYLQQWKDSHGGQAPQAYKEKTEFREMVRKGARTKNAEGGEENFDEAAGAVLKSLNPATPSSAVKEVFDAPECQNLSATSPNFWVIAAAIHTFYQQHNTLPLSGTLPDMKAKSADYIALQNIYKSKARADATEVKSTVHKLDAQLKRPFQTAPEEIDAFCKSAGYIKLVRGGQPHFTRPEGKEWALEDRAKAAKMALMDPSSLMPLYVAFMAYDKYANTHQLAADTEVATGTNMQAPHSASLFDDPAEKTITKVTSIAKTFMDLIITEAGSFLEEPEYSQLKEQLQKIITDLVNAQGGELHNISALMGGIVAQEAIKVITKQYVPADNTCLFDGVGSRSGVLRL